MSRYDIDNGNGTFEPGSGNEVLANKLGIKTVSDMDDAETALLHKLYEFVFKNGVEFEPVNFQLIQEWHRKWLGKIYSWAGELRNVNLSKGGFEFAGAHVLDRLVEKFEIDYLSHVNELNTMELDALVKFLARSHVEFILIHPFKEGNGRISRLLLDVMAVRAGLSPLDYSLWDEHRDYYFRSIQAGLAGNFEPIERLIRDVILSQG